MRKTGQSRGSRCSVWQGRLCLLGFAMMFIAWRGFIIFWTLHGMHDPFPDQAMMHSAGQLANQLVIMEQRIQHKIQQKASLTAIPLVQSLREAVEAVTVAFPSPMDGSSSTDSSTASVKKGNSSAHNRGGSSSSSNNSSSSSSSSSGGGGTVSSASSSYSFIEKSATTGPPKIHAVTYASHGGRDDRFCRAVESALRHNITLVVLGWGVPWTGLSQKLQAAHDYAAGLPSGDAILFTDAFDIMYVSSLPTIASRFAALQTNILFSGECGCWPHIIINESLCFDAYPAAPTPYRYLNSGTWIGYAQPATRMLKKVIEEAGVNFNDANDQKLIADLYIGGRFGIKLDFYNKIFQSMHMTLEAPLPRCAPHEDIISTQGTFYNAVTRSAPAIFHFNGGGKRYHLRTESQLWYKKRRFNVGEELDRLKAQNVTVPTSPSGQMTFQNLCGNYTRDLSLRHWHD